MIHKLRDVRNKQFAHNTSMEVPDHKFTKVFNILGVLFRDQNLIGYIDSDTCLERLENIKFHDPLESSLERIETELQDMREHENAKFDEISDAVRLGNISVRQQIQKSRYEITTELVWFAIFIFMLIVCLITYFYPIGFGQQNRTMISSKRHKRKYSH